MNAVRVVRAESVAPSPWRNGGGFTRELLALPAGADWRVRVSLAEITRDGPFSPFPGVHRWFGVLHGDGVRLALPDGAIELRPGDPPIAFDGAAAPGCTLLGGPTRDLNLMLRFGAHGVLRRAVSGEAWDEGHPERGFFSSRAGRWVPAVGEALDLPAQALLWPAGHGRFEAAAPGPCGFWIGARGAGA